MCVRTGLSVGLALLLALGCSGADDAARKMLTMSPDGDGSGGAGASPANSAAGAAGTEGFDNPPGTSTVSPPPPTPIAGTAAIFPPLAGGGAPPLPTDTRPVVHSEVPPAPINGGTLLIAGDDQTAIVADPDRDRVVFVDLVNVGVLGIVQLDAGDEPGRLVEDADGRVHVVLRRAGELAVLDVASRTLLRRDAACPVPQGVAYDAALDAVHVACTGGELVTMSAADGSIVRSLRLDPDLRDVVVGAELLYVSRFKTAELLSIDRDGDVVGRRSPRDFVDTVESMVGPEGFPTRTMAPFVAWKLVQHSDGSLSMLHQRGQVEPIDIGIGDESEDCTDCEGVPQDDANLIPPPGLGPGGSSYGGGFECSSIVETNMTHFDEAGPTSGPLLGGAPLAVDAAVSPDGEWVALAVAGSSEDPTEPLFTPPVGTVVISTRWLGRGTECLTPGFGFPDGWSMSTGQTVAVAFDGDGRLVVQTRDPNRLRIYADVASIASCPSCATLDISLGGESRRDTGHDLFHIAAGSGLACASCHPGGGDDGRAWNFKGLGPRRTQLVNVGIAGTEPLHWDGELASFNDLVNEVFVRRMGGAPQSTERVGALAGWIDTLRPHAPAIAADDPSVERGRALFESDEVGCTTCHSGAKLTNNTSYDVGTGGNFQVPSLVGVFYHQPYIHTGCAQTLADRFDPACGGDAHGQVEQLSDAEIGDLVAYLQSL